MVIEKKALRGGLHSGEFLHGYMYKSPSSNGAEGERMEMEY